MTISSASGSSVDSTRVPDRTLWFYQGRLEDNIHRAIVGEFHRQEDAGLITRAALARRLGRRPEQITRWLTQPSNLTLDTMSDLLVGLRVAPDLTIDQLPLAEEDRDPAPFDFAPALAPVPANVAATLMTTNYDRMLSNVFGAEVWSTHVFHDVTQPIGRPMCDPRSPQRVPAPDGESILRKLAAENRERKAA